MPEQNIDTSRLPKFNHYTEAVEYFDRFGKLTFFGWVGRNRQMAVYTFLRKNGVEYFVDIYEDGEVAVRLKNNVQDF
ncbi:hypothetical protein [Paenibacillus oryzisoli]|uniref:Uncharacterized protein n=1 Tax=Paenibacillus oryzisoli TaxID=1850517 RepID=A0A198ADS1_9BACL|nr:hypothetical protein [Paenibacillus oryzisoli]OAS19235.1 hypothetical protein A8708_26350 [Paenibacillus oryzisoli]